jgi:hypothetical protein
MSLYDKVRSTQLLQFSVIPSRKCALVAASSRPELCYWQRAGRLLADDHASLRCTHNSHVTHLKSPAAMLSYQLIFTGTGTRGPLIA